jgi:GT2 family glycosyltransferase
MSEELNATDERLLSGGCVGYLDTPHPGQVIDDDVLTVRGWVLGGQAPVDGLTLRHGRTTAIKMSCDLARTDVAQAYPDHEDAATSGFEARIDLRNYPAGRWSFELWAAEGGHEPAAIFSRHVTIRRARPLTFFEILRTAFAKAIAAFRDGRLSASPAQWVRDLRLHHAEMRRLAAPQSRNTAPFASRDIKDALTQLYLAQLRCFLDSGARLTFAPVPEPVVSIVLVLFNRAELTLRCLRSLLETASLPFEIILVDNGSTDLTDAMLSRLDNVTMLSQQENVGFLRGVNDGVRLARGKYLLLLNNDTEVLPGALDAAVDRLERDATIGAVGARLVLPDGRLQEAGSIIWCDGSCAGYGRGDSPHAPEYQFRRDVDYCSGAFLLTPRSLFDEMDGFDEDYQPAYYEEVDYCVRLLKRGLRVVYEPRAVVSHFEFASSRSVDAVRMQTERRSIFVRKHATWLQGQPAPGKAPQVWARARTGDARRILYLDDRVPFDHLGSGFPRARLLLQSLVRHGDAVTLYPMTAPQDDWARVYEALPLEVEVMLERGAEGLRAFLEERRGFYDCIIVSRPHNLRLLRSAVQGEWPPAPLIYDAEAMFSLRDIAARSLAGATVSEADRNRCVNDEVALANGASLVACVSEQEAGYFRAAGHGTTTLAHAVDCAPTSRSFSARRGFLFVGALNADGTPNSDSVIWFTREVLPRIQRQLGPVELLIIGERPPPQVMAIAGESVKVIGRVDELAEHFDAARVFLAPTRFAAGIPLKILHAAAFGVPVVCTTVLQRQLGWTDGVELLVADDPDGFAAACCRAYEDEALWNMLRHRALERVGSDFSQHHFDAALSAALNSVAPRASAL